MSLKTMLGIHHATVDQDGHPHCWRCDTDLVGQQSPGGRAAPIRCPSCRTRNYPDLRRGPR